MKFIVASVMFLLAFGILQRPIVLQAQEPLDGPTRIFKDDLLDNLVGNWKLSARFRAAQRRIQLQSHGFSIISFFRFI